MIDFFPLPFVTGILIILYAGIRHRKRGKTYQFGLTLFGLYVLIAAAKVFFPIPYVENWPENITWENAYGRLAHINWIPFNYGTMFLYDISPRIIFWEIAGNILLTVPFGFFACYLTSLRGKRLISAALLTGFAIEGLQLLIGLVAGYYYHSVDINDVLLNASGVLIGSGLFVWFNKAVRMVSTVWAPGLNKVQ